MTDAAGQLGAFLRSRRERLRPEQLGLAGPRRRRTPGLRREEVANLAGISTEWYLKLEQGRPVAPSAATIDALSQALRLNEVEHAHLHMLAHGERHRVFAREVVPAPLRRLIESLPHPAYVTGLRWDVLAWNEAAALLADFDALAIEDRDILLYVLVDPKGRRLFGEGWEAEARRMVALFRATHDVWAADPAFAGLIARLRAVCAEFDAWWGAHDVGAALSGTKVLHHPTQGRLCFDYTTFQANDDPRLKLAVYLPRRRGLDSV